MYGIIVEVNSANPLPPNLGVALNGKSVDVDECKPGGWFSSTIKLSEDRTKATIDITFFQNLEDFRFYFPQGFEEPTSNVIDLTFYSRQNCRMGWD